VCHCELTVCASVIDALLLLGALLVVSDDVSGLSLSDVASWG